MIKVHPDDHIIPISSKTPSGYDAFFYYSEDYDSRFLQTSWRISVETPILLTNPRILIHKIGSRDVNDLAEKARKRNPFSRHSYESDFYVQRLREFSGKTVIDIFIEGSPDNTIIKSQKAANTVEKLILLSSIFAVSREQFLKQYGITSYDRTNYDISIGPRFRFLKTKKQSKGEHHPLMIDERTYRRFYRCRFPKLISSCLGDTKISKRLNNATSWLFQSRYDPSLQSSTVKTAIALESLLMFDEHESITQSLSERAAFLLSNDTEIRNNISRLIKRFYSIRSGIVHGSKKRNRKPNIRILESIDRIVLILCIIIAENDSKWKTNEDLKNWFLKEKFGAPDLSVNVPLPEMYLSNAINRGMKELGVPK